MNVRRQNWTGGGKLLPYDCCNPQMGEERNAPGVCAPGAACVGEFRVRYRTSSLSSSVVAPWSAWRTSAQYFAITPFL